MTSVKKPTRQDDAAVAHLDEELARWTAKGAITTQQAEAIRHIEEANEPAPAGTRIPLVAQALGFLGGALAIIAGIVATSRFWDELSTPARLGLVGTVAILLGVAGRIVRRGDEPALENLGSFLWVLATGCTAFWTGIAAVDVVNLEGADVATAIGAVCLVVAAGLWKWRPAPLQQVATFAALALTVGSIAGHVEHVGGLFVGVVLWGVAVVWLVLAWLGVVSPAPIAYATGALLAIVGGGVVGNEARFGDVLAVVTVVSILAASVPTRSMVLLWMGVIGVFQTLPTAITRHFGDSLGAPLILFLVGVSLIGVAVIASRLAPEIRSAPRQIARISQRTIATGMLSAVVVIVGLTMGLTNIPAVPTYPSLQASPDLTLTGSVAFVRAGAKPCLFVTAASGATTPKRLYCDAAIDHGPGGLSWSNGHVLVHRWTEKSGAQLTEVDPVTGRVLGHEAAHDENKGMPSGVQRADGAIVEIQGDNGHPRVVIRAASGQTRTVFEPTGPRDYWLADVAWSPDGNHVIVGDSENRLLIVAAESASHRTRLLVANAMWPAWSDS